MVSSVLLDTSPVQHTKKCSGIDSENKSVKQNAGQQDHLTVSFYVLRTLGLPYIKKTIVTLTECSDMKCLLTKCALLFESIKDI